MAGEIDVANLRKMLDETVTQWAAGVAPTDSPTASVEDTPVKADGTRAVRSKGSGDRVFLLDDNAKTKRWITSPEVLKELGFEAGDVVEVEDSELAGYQMSPSVYRVVDGKPA